MRFSAAALCAVVLFGDGPNPAQGQDPLAGLGERSPNPLLEDFDKRLGRAQADRLRAYYETRPQLVEGWCESRLANLNNLHELIESQQGRMSAATLAIYRQSLAQERAYPCPPGGPPTPPPPPLPPPPPAPRTTTIMREGDGPARTTPPATEEEMARNLENQIHAYDTGPFLPGTSVQQPVPPSSPPPAPPPPPQGLTQQDADEVARQQNNFDSSARERAEEAAARSRASLHIAGGLGESTMPSANYAFQRDGAAGTAPDRPAAFSEKRVPVFILEGALQFPRIGSFSLGYREGDARNHVEIAASTAGSARGYPYIAAAPSGSTGIGGNVPIAVDTNVSIHEYGFRYRYSLDGAFEAAIEEGSSAQDALEYQLYLQAWASARDRDHLGVVSITTPVTATQTIAQDLDERELGVAVEGRAIMPLGDAARFIVGAEAGGYYYDFNLASVQTNDQNFGPAADRAFTAALDDGKSGIGYRGDAIAELGVDLSRSLELFVSGRASYFSHRGRIQNPFSGDFVLEGGTTFIGTDDAFDWQVTAGLRLRLGSGQR